MCFEGDKDTMVTLVGLRKKGAGARRKATSGEHPGGVIIGRVIICRCRGRPVLPGQLWNIIVMIMTNNPAFGFTISQTKVEIMCLRTKGMTDATATFSINEASKVYKHVSSYATESQPQC